MFWLVKSPNVDRFVVLLTVLDSFKITLLQFRKRFFQQTQISGKQYKFLCETSCLSLCSKKSRKYAFGLLQKEKKAFKYQTFPISTLLRYAKVTFTKQLSYKPTFKRHSIIIMLLPKAWIYLQNACCIQLNLVFRERVNHNCMEIPCEQWILSCMAFRVYEVVRSIINKPTTQLTSNANDFMNAKSYACKRESSGWGKWLLLTFK